MKLRIPLWHVLLLSSLCGCADQLIYTHNTALGVDVGVRPDETNGFIMVGYDRDTYAIVPKANPKKDSGRNDAMSLASVSCLDIEGLSQFHYNQFIATGASASHLAKDSEAMKQIRMSLYGAHKKCVAD